MRDNLIDIYYRLTDGQVAYMIKQWNRAYPATPINVATLPFVATATMYKLMKGRNEPTAWDLTRRFENYEQGKGWVGWV